VAGSLLSKIKITTNVVSSYFNFRRGEEVRNFEDEN